MDGNLKLSATDHVMEVHLTSIAKTISIFHIYIYKSLWGASKTHDFKPEISLTNAKTDLVCLFLKLHYLWQESGLHNAKSEKLTPGTHTVSSLPTTIPSPAKKEKKPV